jgi:hypothetical protein
MPQDVQAGGRGDEGAGREAAVAATGGSSRKARARPVLSAAQRPGGAQHPVGRQHGGLARQAGRPSSSLEVVLMLPLQKRCRARQGGGEAPAGAQAPSGHRS